MFRRWPVGTFPLPDPPLTLPDDDSTWPESPCSLPYTNMHVSESGKFHLAGRVYDAGGGLTYDAGPYVVHDDAPSGVKWLVVDDDACLYALSIRWYAEAVGESFSQGMRVSVWKYDNTAAPETTLLAEIDYPAFLGAWVGAGVVDVTWGLPRLSLIDVRNGWLVFAGPGATFGDASYETHFRYNNFFTRVNTSTGASTRHDTYAYDLKVVVILDGEGNPIGGGAPEEPAPSHIRVGSDGAVYIAWDWRTRDETVQGGSPWGFQQVMTDVTDTDTVTAIPGDDEFGRYYTRRGGDLEDYEDPPGSGFVLHKYTGPFMQHFDVDSDGVVVLGLRINDPDHTQGEAYSTHALVKLTPTVDPDTFTNDTSDDYDGYTAKGYTQTWLVIDSDLLNPPGWPIHDGLGGAYYLSQNCLRQTDGVTAPSNSYVWAREKLTCSTRSPAWMRRDDVNLDPADCLMLTATDGDRVRTDADAQTDSGCDAGCTDVSEPPTETVETECHAAPLPAALHLSVIIDDSCDVGMLANPTYSEADDWWEVSVTITCPATLPCTFPIQIACRETFPGSGSFAWVFIIDGNEFSATYTADPFQLEALDAGSCGSFSFSLIATA